MTSAISTALNGLTSATQRLNAGASNIANLLTSGSLTDPENPPYTPLTTQSKALSNPAGIRTDVVPKDPAFVPAFDPDSPFADENGLVGIPNINLEQEVVNLKLAEITYKANIATLKASENLTEELLSILDEEA